MNRQAVINARHLGFDAHPGPGDPVRFGAGDVVSTEQHLATGGFELAAKHLEEGALAGPVGPDQAAQLAFAQGEINLVDSGDAAEALAEVARFENRVHSAGLPLSAALCW